MGSCLLSVLSLLNLLVFGAMNEFLQVHAAFGTGNIRLRRQAGYVYDRPTISFNLPSQTSVDSAPTQGTTVDRTSAQQMFYAYPVPSGGSTVNRNYISPSITTTTSTGSSGAAGYNYGQQNVVATGPTGTTTIVTSSSRGYNEGQQNIPLAQSGATTSSDTSTSSAYNNNQQNVAGGAAISTGSVGSVGYNYGQQNGPLTSTGTTSSSGSGTSTGYNYSQQNNIAISAGATTSTDTAGSNGYNYETNSGVSGSTGTITTSVTSALNGYSSGQQNVGTGPTGLSTTTSGTSSGYSDAKQNTGVVATALTSSTGSNGYSYNVQSTANRGPPTATSTVTRLYNTPTTGSNDVSSVGNTRRYLPPIISNDNTVSVLTNTQTGSGVVPSDLYLPSNVLNPQRTITQTNIATENIVRQPANVPKSSYLTPNSISKGVTQNMQTQIQSGGPVQSVATQEYLPPVISSVTVTQQKPSTPAPTYLPPVF